MHALESAAPVLDPDKDPDYFILSLYFSTIGKNKKCQKGCPRISRPVCASNGKTYGNECTFRNAKCSNKKLRIVHKGRCNGELLQF